MTVLSMLLQFCQVCKHLTAQTAGEWSTTCVLSQVILQQNRLWKLLVAVRTDAWVLLLVRVARLSVIPQRRMLLESHLAFVTFVRFLAGVASSVID